MSDKEEEKFKVGISGPTAGAQTGLDTVRGKEKGWFSKVIQVFARIFSGPNDKDNERTV